jgi:pseudouridine-5'-phosphate glycosidase
VQIRLPGRDNEQLTRIFHIGVDVARAFKMRLPVVALESAVITHGLPHPENINLAMQMETEVSNQGAVPATIGLMDGKSDCWICRQSR